MKCRVLIVAFVSVVPAFAQGQSNVSATQAECNQLHEDRRRLAIPVMEQQLQRQRSQSNPNAFVVRSSEKSLAAAKSMDGAAYFDSLGGLMSPGHMESFMGKLSLKDLNSRIGDSRKMLAALESGDLNTYASISGAKPRNASDVAYSRALARSDLCAYLVRHSQMTRKPIAAADRTWLNLGSSTN